MACGCNLRKRINSEKLKLSQRDIYLDYNATTKPSLESLSAVDKINRNFWGNPSAQNSRGVSLYNILESNIDETKKILNCNEYNCYFDTSSTSIVYNISILPIKYSIITTTIEHKSLTDVSDYIIGVDSNGKMDLSSLKNILSKSISNPLVIISPVNHETGNIQSIKEIFNITEEFNTPVIFDAVQTISRIPIKEWLPYCSGFYFSGHKIHGLQGAAVIYIKENIIDFGTKENPLPFSIYKGTFNTSSVIALLESTKTLFKSFHEYASELTILHKEALIIIKKLEEFYYMESEIGGTPGIINISFPSIDKIEDLLIHLNRNGIQVGRLSACSGDINMESTVLTSMGRNSKRSSTSIRISFGKDSKRDDFFKLTASIRSFLASYNI